MSKSNSKEERDLILNAISKHPNTKFAKLFREVDDSPNQKNIVLLLIELTQQKDFYVDFNVSLQYFLNLYEKVDAASKEFLFNETGLLIFNATQIYSRRVDCVQQRLEDQLAELSKGQESKEKSPDETSTELEKPEKPKRRKRLVENNDPYEIELVTRKFRKLTPVKRFACGSKLDTSKIFSTNLHTENYTHPALWKHAEIVDLENDELDSKKNYRLFTSHVEHRYNTLMPDINFLMYYKMKDFIEEKDERDGEGEFSRDSEWPPLSQEYLTRYLKLEDQALALNTKPDFFKPLIAPSTVTVEQQNIDNPCETAEEKMEVQSNPKEGNETDLIKRNNEFNSCDAANLDTSQNQKSINASIGQSQADSGIGTSIFELSSDLQETVLETDRSLPLQEAGSPSTEKDSVLEATSNSNSVQFELDTAISNNLETNIDTDALTINSTVNSELDLLKNKPDEVTESSKSINTTATKMQVDLNETPETGTQKEDIDEAMEIIVHIDSSRNGNCVSTDLCASLSPTNDEGVYFSDIDDSPINSPMTIYLDLKTLNDGEENVNDTKKTYVLPEETIPTRWPIEINILKFPHNVLRKMRRKLLLTNLGEDMELFLKSRCYKRTRMDTVVSPRKYKFDPGWVDFSPPSPVDANLLGFSEKGDIITEEPNEKNKDITKSPGSSDSNLRLSRDSGVGNDLLTANSDKSTMFFRPISEEADDIQKELLKNNEDNGIEILEDILIDSGNKVPSNEILNKENNSEELIGNQADFVEKSASEKQLEITATTEVDLSKRDCETQESIEKNSETRFPRMIHTIETESLKLNEHIELSETVAAKIQKWHKHLQPILANSSQRHHFDVFKIGTDIIEDFNHSESITFQDVMKQKDQSYVSRYFLSTLLLANQGNLELNVNNKNDSNPSEWHDLNLKLISKTRHVVSMEDNIGLTSINTVQEISKPPTISEVKTKSLSAKKRCRDINSIKLIKPIGKVLRKSDDYDSGIYSNDDFDNL